MLCRSIFSNHSNNDAGDGILQLEHLEERGFPISDYC